MSNHYHLVLFINQDTHKNQTKEKPEESDFTSIQERLYDHGKRVRFPSPQKKCVVRQFKNNVVDKRDYDLKQAPLTPLNGSSFAHLSEGIPFMRQDYFELVDWTGRVL